LISPTITKVLRTAPPTLEIDIRIHVTQHDSGSIPSQKSRSTFFSENHEISTSSHQRDPEKVVISELSDKQASSMLDLSAVSLISGRPNIPDILKEEADAVRGGRMGVSGTLFSISRSKQNLLKYRDPEVCGSNSMIHSTRSALGMNVSGPAAVMKGGASVSLFVEVFGYA
jgi:ferric-chelate reductase